MEHEIEQLRYSEKFRAETYRIFGLALFTPLGQIVLNPFNFYNQFGGKYYFAYLLISYSLTFAGIACIEKANAIMKKLECL